MTFDLPFACSPLKLFLRRPGRKSVGGHNEPRATRHHGFPSFYLVVTEDLLDVFEVAPSSAVGSAAGGIACGRPLVTACYVHARGSFPRRARNRRLAPPHPAPPPRGREAGREAGPESRQDRHGLLLDATAGGHLADPEDDEFRGLHRG